MPDLYFAGTLTHIHDFRVAASGFIHGFRYNCQALHSILLNRYHGQPIPSKILSKDPEQLMRFMIDRANYSAPLFL